MSPTDYRWGATTVGSGLQTAGGVQLYRLEVETATLVSGGRSWVEIWAPLGRGSSIEFNAAPTLACNR
jgi:hypothetical protein